MVNRLWSGFRFIVRSFGFWMMNSNKFWPKHLAATAGRTLMVSGARKKVSTVTLTLHEKKSRPDQTVKYRSTRDVQVSNKNPLLRHCCPFCLGALSLCLRSKKPKTVIVESTGFSFLNLEWVLSFCSQTTFWNRRNSLQRHKIQCHVRLFLAWNTHF